MYCTVPAKNFICVRRDGEMTMRQIAELISLFSHL